MTGRSKTAQPGAGNKPGEDSRKKFRDTVNLIFPDGLMVVLAVIMVPIVIVPLFVDLKASIEEALHFADYAIVGIFVLEYFLKAFSAADIRKHVLNPWHLLDLLVVILPFFDFLEMVGGFGRWSPVLRLFRLLRVLAAGSRAVDRKIKQRPVEVSELRPLPEMNVRVVDRELNNVLEKVPPDRVAGFLNNAYHTWIDISSVSESRLDELSYILGIPRLVLESELTEESYPRIDYFENYALIFARVANMFPHDKGSKRILVERSGLLIVCYGQNIITVSRASTGIFRQILEKARKFHGPEEPLLVSVLYSILKLTLEKDKEIITALEKELMTLESLPLKSRPDDFLETTFHLKKEVNQLVPALLHKKEMAAMIASRRVPLEGFSERHEKLFDILADEAAYLQETAENARDNLLSLIDLYINTTSFELNRVMRIIAVITSLGIFPALAGLFGSNISGNPWDIELWQLFGVLGVLMLALSWVFYRLGWLKW